MIKNMISNRPDEANLQQFLECVKGKVGIDEKSGDKYIMDVNLSEILRRLTSLEGTP